ncbi:MAG: hypothetical protein QM713_17540 [Arachnia sp.]
MPTFHDSVADAAEASEALRGLAHASRVFDQPAEMYGVIGDLSSGIRSLRQVLDQIADVHERKAAHAFHDDGNHDAGVRDALTTAEELRQSARLVDQAYDRLAEGFVAAGRIAWHPEPVAEQVAGRRWVSVVFLQGDEADEVLDLIDAQGTDAAIKHLAGYDYGDETVEAAIANGHVYDEPQAGATDRTATRDVYTLTYNVSLGHVGLYREATALPDPALLGIDAPIEVEAVPVEGGSVEARRVGGPADQDWFASPASASGPAGRRGWSL